MSEFDPNDLLEPCPACDGLGTDDNCCCERYEHDPRFCPQGPCPVCGGTGEAAAINEGEG